MVKKENGPEDNDLEKLGNAILAEKPGEYTFGKEGETGCIITYLKYIVGGSGEKPKYVPVYSARLSSPPKIILRGNNGGIMDIVDKDNQTLRDIDDSDGKTMREVVSSSGVVRDPYRNLRLKSPRNVTFEKPKYPGELGDLEIGLENNKGIGICYYERRE